MAVLYGCVVTRGQVGRRKEQQGWVGNRTGANEDKGMAEGRETRETMGQGMEWSDMGENNKNQEKE